MPSPAYWLEKIHEAINKPNGDHAFLALTDGGYIDSILKHCQSSLNFDEVKKVADEIREYIRKNRTAKFGTKSGARKLVSKLNELMKST